MMEVRLCSIRDAEGLRFAPAILSNAIDTEKRKGVDFQNQL